jgi:hypothetical protein
VAHHGVLFGIIALIAIAGMPMKAQEDEMWDQREARRAAWREKYGPDKAPILATVLIVVAGIGLCVFLSQP